MTYKEMVKAISAILPGATFDEDMEGQIVIYTDMQKTDPSDDALLAPFNSEEEGWDSYEPNTYSGS